MEAIDDAIRREFDDPTKQTASPRGGITTTPTAPPATDANSDAQPTEAEPNSLIAIFDRISGPGTTFALTLLFTMFLLLQYEDIRDRIIRLAGTENLSGTTAAMSDAGSRLSKLFLRKLCSTSHSASSPASCWR